MSFSQYSNTDIMCLERDLPIVLQVPIERDTFIREGLGGKLVCQRRFTIDGTTYCSTPEGLTTVQKLNSDLKELKQPLYIIIEGDGRTPSLFSDLQVLFTLKENVRIVLKDCILDKVEYNGTILELRNSFVQRIKIGTGTQTFILDEHSFQYLLFGQTQFKSSKIPPHVGVVESLEGREHSILLTTYIQSHL